jgi:hypothetical protein
MMRSKFLHILTALAVLPMPAGRLLLAPPTRSLRKLQFEPQGKKARERLVLLLGRFELVLDQHAGRQVIGCDGELAEELLKADRGECFLP